VGAITEELTDNLQNIIDKIEEINLNTTTVTIRYFKMKVSLMGGWVAAFLKLFTVINILLVSYLLIVQIVLIVNFLIKNKKQNKIK